MKKKITVLLIIIHIILLSSCERQEHTYTSLNGSWRCDESHPVLGFRSYLTEIDHVVNKDSIYIISNFYNAGYNEFIFALLSEDELIINKQVITTLFVNGSGTYSNDYKNIYWEYEVDDGVQIINVTAKYSRK